MYLIPTSLVAGTLHGLNPEIVRILHQTTHYIVENARTARRFIKSTEPPYTIESLQIVELDKHQEDDPEKLLAPVFEGHDLGILSEAGCPGIADPGSAIVLYAHSEGIRVVPLTGPSSILLALMASGLNGQRFQFHGYLSPKKERIASGLANLSAETFFCIAVDLTSEQEFVQTHTIGEWHTHPVPELHKHPAVFCILAH